MALTNEQITAQNFKDFYSQIRPYLNGNVPTFANTFNKSDLYNTDEQLVGRWIDGKPIYQKVYNNITISPSANELDVASLNIDSIISMSGKYVYNNDYVYNFSHVDSNGGLTYSCDLFFRKSTNKITFLIGSAINNGNVSNLIIQYTKTTDSSMSVSDGNEYSLDEQVIGHWIDGKPVYQKTLIATGTMSSGAELGTIDNLKRVIKLDGGFLDSNNSHGIFPWVYTNQFADVFVNSSNNKVTIVFNQTVKDPIVTIQYTKTTD